MADLKFSCPHCQQHEQEQEHVKNMTLAELFPDADYRFRMLFERAPEADFFQPTAQHVELLAQRSYWLESEPLRHSGLLAAGVPLLDEVLQFAQAHGAVLPENHTCTAGDLPAQARAQCLGLGKSWEPDFLLLAVEPDSTARLVGGCVCFPSSWSLEEKIGQPIEGIHEIVPGLNSAIGPQIHAFLARLRPGIAWQRSNWGLSRTPELNQHPARGLPRLDDSVHLEEVWLRVEHQALLALPQTKGVLFGIRIASHRLATIYEDKGLTAALARALATMPEALARYKGLDCARPRLLSLLRT